MTETEEAIALAAHDGFEWQEGMRNGRNGELVTAITRDGEPMHGGCRTRSDAYPDPGHAGTTGLVLGQAARRCSRLSVDTAFAIVLQLIGRPAGAAFALAEYESIGHCAQAALRWALEKRNV